MNEFTKEELETMRWYLQKEILTPPIEHINLLFKIQSMIEHYCEHESSFEVEIKSFNHSKECRHEIDKEKKRCSKCGISARGIPCVGGWL